MPSRPFRAALLAVPVAAALLAACLVSLSVRAADDRRQLPYFGATFGDLTPSQCRQLGIKSGALITDVDLDGPADKSGLLPGDVIFEFELKDITSAHQLNGLIRDMRPDEMATFRMWRGHRESGIFSVKLGSIDAGTPVVNGIVDPELADRLDRLEGRIDALERRLAVLESARRPRR